MDKDLDALVEAIVATGKSLDEGEAIYSRLARVVRNIKVGLWVAGIGLAADLLLTTAFGFILNNQSELNDRIQANQTAIHDAECQLNTLFITADTPAARDRSPDKTMYDKSYHQIYQQRVQLNCQPPATEPVRP